MISLTTWAFFQAGRKEPEDTFLAPKAEELPRPRPAEVCGNSGCWTVASNTMQYMQTIWLWFLWLWFYDWFYYWFYYFCCQGLCWYITYSRWFLHQLMTGYHLVTYVDQLAAVRMGLILISYSYHDSRDDLGLVHSIGWWCFCFSGTPYISWIFMVKTMFSGDDFPLKPIQWVVLYNCGLINLQERTERRHI